MLWGSPIPFDLTERSAVEAVLEVFPYICGITAGLWRCFSAVFDLDLRLRGTGQHVHDSWRVSDVGVVAGWAGCSNLYSIAIKGPSDCYKPAAAKVDPSSVFGYPRHQFAPWCWNHRVPPIDFPSAMYCSLNLAFCSISRCRLAPRWGSADMTSSHIFTHIARASTSSSCRRQLRSRVIRVNCRCNSSFLATDGSITKRC